MPCAALSSFGAPTASVLPSPLTSRRMPNQSCLPTLEALKFACSVHVVPLRTNTYAAPDELSSGPSTTPEWPLCTTLMPGTMVSSSRAPVAADRNPAAHRILSVAFLRLQVRLLRPGRAVAGEDVDRSGAGRPPIVGS